MPLKMKIVCKNSGEICLCVEYRKLNSITIWDAFPLPHINEALQMVHSSNVFPSFDLKQGYFQLAMAEDDIKKTTFRAGSSGLYDVIHAYWPVKCQVKILQVDGAISW